MTPMLAQFYLPLTGDSREDLGMTPRQDGDRRFSASALLRYQLSHLTRYQFRPPMQSRLVLLTGRTKQSPGLYTGTYVFIQNAVCYPSRTYPHTVTHWSVDSPASHSCAAFLRLSLSLEIFLKKSLCGPFFFFFMDRFALLFCSTYAMSCPPLRSLSAPAVLLT